MSELTIRKILSAHAWGDSLLIRGKALKDVFSVKNDQKNTGSSSYDAQDGQNTVLINSEDNKNTLRMELQEELEKSEIRRAKENLILKGWVMKILKQPEIVADMKSLYLEMDTNKSLAVMASGVANMIDEFKAGESVVMAELYVIVADKDDDLSQNYLRLIRALLEEAGLLILRDAKNVRWANKEELKAIAEIIKEGRKAKLLRTSVNKRDVKEGTLKTCLTYLPKNRVVKKSTDAYKKWAIAKAKKDEYSTIDADGNIEKISKPLKGDLNHREKKLKRDYADAEASYKLIMKTANLKDRAFQKEMMKKEQELERMKYDLRREAELRMQQQRIERAEALDGAKPLLIVAALALAVYLFMSSDSGEPLPAFQPQNATYVENPAEVSNENYVMEGKK